MAKQKKLPRKTVEAPRVSSSTYWMALGLVFALSALFHFTALYHPYAVVFDEFHFGKFVTAYTHTGERIFDIHPPHSKLLIALGAKWGGYAGNFGFERIGQPFVAGVHAETMRWMPALWGTLIPVFTFLILSTLGVSVLWAFAGAAVVLLDNGLLVQTRIIALDGSLILFSLISLWATIKAVVNLERNWHWVVLSGAAAAMAVGTKYTGLVAPALMGATLLLFPWWEKSEKHFRPAILRAGIFVAAFAVVFTTGWAIHFSLLTKSGYADLFYKESGNFWVDMFNLQASMLSANANITQSHPDQSSWWQWAFDRKPSYYWEEAGNRIYFVGNPVIWFGATFAALVLTAWVATTKKANRWLWVCLAGFWMSWLPYAFVKRALFLYHFLPPLSFALLASFLYLGTKEWKNRRWERGALAALMVAVLFGFWLVSPWTFGTSPNSLQLDYLDNYLLKSP